jgi:hypothetical protein
MNRFAKLFSLVFILIFLMIPGMASASPAPALTNVQIIAVTSTGQNYVWDNIAFNDTSAHTPMSGDTGVLAIYCAGTILGSFPAVYSNGDLVTTYSARDSSFVTDSSGNVVGTIYYRAFDLSDVTSGDFAASASNYYPPNQTYTDHLNIDVN